MTLGEEVMEVSGAAGLVEAGPIMQSAAYIEDIDKSHVTCSRAVELNDGGERAREIAIERR